jgi:hypothetical protein
MGDGGHATLIATAISSPSPDDLFLYREARSIGVERIIGAPNGATDTSLLDELDIDAGF